MGKVKSRYLKKCLIFAAVLTAWMLGTVPVQAKTSSKITLNYKNVTMQAGSSLNLHTASAKGLKSSRKVTWKSSNKKVATVNKNGVVKAKKSGTATITATTKDKKSKVSCKVKVQKKKSTKSKVLVVYFSCTDTTKGIAKKIASVTKGDIYRITPAKAYTSKDLDYGDDSSRATKEQGNRKYRPQLKGKAANIKEYDYIFIGYPIWHGQAPRIISTFLESYDFSGKKIIPFCTSHSSGIGSSDTNLHSLCSDSVTWEAGKRFAAGTSKEEIETWLKEHGTVNPPDTASVSKFALSEGKNGQAPTVKLNSGYDMPILGIGTYSLLGDTCVNSVVSALQSGYRKIDTAYMYHNEESVGEGVRQSGDKDIEAYHAMERAVAEGKIRSIGLSNWYVKEMEEFLPQVNIMPALVQNEIHPYYQEKEVVPYMHEKGVVMEAWYPLGGRGYTSQLLGNEVISEIAAAHGKSAAQVILRWDLQNGVVVIPGSSNPEHIRENISIFDFELTEEEMEKIGQLDRNEKHDWY